MEVANEFTKKFHGSTGVRFKDRMKALHILFNSYQTIENDENVLKEISTNLLPRTSLEETYKFEFLLHFKRFWELFEILKNGNDIFTNRILKRKWFVTAILKDFRPKEFLRDIFPQFSLVARLKILNQILKNFKDEAFINLLFDELIEMYDVKYALVLISGCSLDKIKNFLTEREVRMSLAQLKQFHDKDRSLIRFYYDEYQKWNGDFDYLEPFSIYLTKRDPTLFMELILKHKFEVYCDLGHKGTKLFVNQNTDALIEDPMKYLELNVLKTGSLLKELGKNFPRFLKATFPASWNDLVDPTHHVFNLLNHYPRKRRYDLFSTVFKEVYNKDLFHAKEIINDEILEVIPSHEEREKWVKLLDNRIDLIQYKRSTVAVPKLKKNLFRTDNFVFRDELFSYIVISCSVSEDYETLLDFLKLVCKRYRSVGENAFEKLFNTICDKIKFKKLNEEHWKYIQEIILLQDLRNLPMNADIIFENCKFLHKSNKSFEKLIPLFLKTDIYYTDLEFMGEDFRDESFQKIFLQLILKYFGTLDETYRNSFKAAQTVLVVKKWNKKHPNDLILASRVESIVQEVQKEVKDTCLYIDGREGNAFKYLISSEGDSHHFENIYFENMNTLVNISTTNWFLKHRPEVFCTYMDEMYPCFTMKNRYLVRFLRELDYLGLTKDICAFYVKKLKQPNQHIQNKSAQLLASIMPKEEYLSLIESYIPHRDKKDISEFSDEEKTSHQIQLALVKSVCFSNCRREALPILLKYWKEDFLPPALYSLYSCFSNIPEEDLNPYLPMMLNKPGSLKMQSIILAAFVFPLNVNDGIREEMMNDKTNISVRKSLFKISYKSFLRNPTEKSLNSLLNQMESLTICDERSLGDIIKIQNIPKSFRGKFTKAVWGILEKMERKENAFMNEYYNKLLNNIRYYDIKLLPMSFCSTIIETKMLDDGLKMNPVCSKFAVKFMMFSGETRQAIVSVMKILADYKTKHWYNLKHAKTEVHLFCKEIYGTAMNTELLEVNELLEFSRILAEEWKRLFKQEETFEEYLMLEFLILKYENGENIQVLASKIRELFEYSKGQYGDQIIILFQNFLNNNLSKLLGEKRYYTKLMEFLMYFVQQGPVSPTRYLLFLNLLPKCCNNDIVKNNCDFVLDQIRSLPDPIISVSLDRYYKRSNGSETFFDRS